VQNEYEGRLKTWIIPSTSTPSWLIYEATMEETPPKIYQLPPLNAIVLERSHVMARTFGVEADGGVVDE
jgi:hypothetical protein